MVAAPLQDCWGVDVPRQVEQDVAGTAALGQKLIEVVAGDAVLFVGDAQLQHVGNAMPIISEVDDVD